MTLPPGFERAMARDRDAVDARLQAIATMRASDHPRIGDALVYALAAGGKRIRPLLCLWTHDLCAGRENALTHAAALEAACAIECVHTYSLVHDDLPCMDDDDLRRGRKSLHRQFDEATAVLTGDALLTLGFDLLGWIDVPATVALETIRVLAAAAGTGGLISGQALDLELTGKPETTRVEVVEQIHERKTARLIAAAMETGAVVAQPGDAGIRERARRAGLMAGSAFQIVDDVLDMTGDAATLGKTPGKDRQAGKPTYAAAVGTAAALEAARERVAQALRELPEAAGTPLAALFDFVAERRR